MWAARNGFLTAGEGQETDPYFSDVVALLHMDGANNSTTLTESSGGAAWTAYGNAKLSTSVVKFGTASLVLDGNADYIKPAASSDFIFGTADFTIELWARFTSLANTPFLFDWRPLDSVVDSPALAVGFLGGAGKVNYYKGDGAVTTSSATLSTGVWYHLAVARASGTTRVFIDGVHDGTYSDSLNYAQNQPTFGALGNYPLLTAYAVNGYIDEIRITKGVARYTSTFAAPTAPFPSA